MGRLILAFRCFFGILFHGQLSQDALTALGLAREAPRKAPEPKALEPGSEDGAVQILSILQRDARLVDFFMEDIAAYDDEQIGAAVRSLHDTCRQTLGRYFELQPVVDGVEGTYTNVAGTLMAGDPHLIKFIGNVPAEPKGGVLRHKGWKATKLELPKPDRGSRVIAPAEIEIE